MIGCDASPPFFLARRKCHCDLQHHHHAVKAVKTTPITRPSKRKLAGRSNQTGKTRIAIERELKAQALLQSEEATPDIESKEATPHIESEEATPRSESEEESDLEVSDSENESDVEFNQ